MVKKWKVYLLAFMSLVICVVTFFGLSTMNAYAFSGANSSLTEQELYNATNTYNVDADCFDKNDIFNITSKPSSIYPTQYKFSYNLVMTDQRSLRLLVK